MSGDDYTSKHGAGVLATLIESYWRVRGFPGVRVERFELYPGADVDAYGVRSNLVNGLPLR